MFVTLIVAFAHISLVPGRIALKTSRVDSRFNYESSRIYYIFLTFVVQKFLYFARVHVGKRLLLSTISVLIAPLYSIVAVFI